MAGLWINLEDKLIYVRYYAVRRKNKKYLGTLEVTQDTMEVQKIQGEK